MVFRDGMKFLAYRVGMNENKIHKLLKVHLSMSRNYM